MTPTEDGALREIDIVLFVVAGRTYGADVTDVVEVSRPNPARFTVARLGDGTGARAFLIRGRLGMAQLPVDRLLEIRRADLGALRRLPEFARGLVEPAVVGFLMDGSSILLLLDLKALVDEHLSAAAAQGAAASPGRLGT